MIQAADLRVRISRTAAFALRELQAERGRGGVLLLRVGAAGVHALIFFGISRWLNPAYFTFIIPGLIFSSLQTLALMLPVEQARRETEQGTLNAILASPARPVEWLAGSSLPRLGAAFLDGLIYLGLGWLLLGAPNLPGLPWLARLPQLLIGWALAGSCLLAAGCVSAAAFLVFRRADALNFVLAPLMELSGGVYFGGQMLPPAVRAVSELFPITHALRLARGTESSAGREIGLLILLNAVYWGLAIGCLRTAIRSRQKSAT